MNKISSLLAIVFIILVPHLQARDYNVDDFGAKPDGKTINTRTLQRPSTT